VDFRDYLQFSMCNPDISVNVRFEVFTAVTMKNGVFWDVTPYSEELSASFIRVQ
jgi:hypothetical protein